MVPAWLNSGGEFPLVGFQMGHLLAVSSHRGEEAPMSLPLLKGTLIPSGRSTPMTLSKFSYLPKPPPPNNHHRGLQRANSGGEGDTNIRFITEGPLSYLKCSLSPFLVKTKQNKTVPTLFCVYISVAFSCLFVCLFSINQQKREAKGLI